jgi:beta-galactosidase
VAAVRADRGLADYRLLWAPQLAMLEEALAERLLAYASGGGHLVLGPRAGFFDGHGALLAARPPGRRLAEALGAHSEEYYSLADPVPVAGDVAAGAASVWAERLRADAPDAQVLLRYGPGHAWLADQPALVTRPVGRGRISYVGAWLDAAALGGVAEWACRAAGVDLPWGRLPEGVEVSCRAGADRRVHVLCNHGDADRAVELPVAGTCALTGRRIEGTLVLAAGEVAAIVEDLARPA